MPQTYFSDTIVSVLRGSVAWLADGCNVCTYRYEIIFWLHIDRIACKKMLHSPSELCRRNTWMIEPWQFGKDSVWALWVASSQGKIVCPPNAHLCCFFPHPGLAVAQVVKGLLLFVTQVIQEPHKSSIKLFPETNKYPSLYNPIAAQTPW